MLRRLLSTWCLALAAAKTSPYSFSLSTFSPEGRIQQIEFAGKAVDNGPPCAAITTRDGVVLAKAYKKQEKTLVVEGHSLHILRVTENTLATYAGLPADFRSLVDAARWRKFPVLQLLWDLAKFYDSVDWAVLLPAARAQGAARPLARRASCGSRASCAARRPPRRP